MTVAVTSIAQDFRCKADRYSAKLQFLSLKRGQQLQSSHTATL